MRAAFIVGLAAAVAVSSATPAAATFPFPAPPAGTPPQSYASYLFLPTATPPVRPNDFSGGTEWKLTSDKTGDPTIDSNPAELHGVKGMSVDRAWQVTTGRPDVLIAVLDSGIKWNDAGAMSDLRRKVHLNRGELPLPQNAGGKTKPELIAAGENFLNPDPYDLNDDGVFNVDDYAADPRVTDRNGNGVLDPQDLIRTFSDGVDNDGNGYVDDIAGWNFLDDDNDPFDEVQYGHGTGEAEDSTAEADNGGALGTCPNCMVLPVRVGDSFIADSNLFAEGVVFAVDSGAHVVQEALGAVNNSSFARAAIDYAYANDVPIIASAADEESFHHNFPSGNRHTITVNSVTKFTELGPVTMLPNSYLYLNGCTNYGGNVALAISSSSCSSEATGRGSGIAGLIISAALNAVDAGKLAPRRTDPTGAVHPLSASEVAELLTMTADDIDFGLDRLVIFPIPTVRFASQKGWDQYFGYGRANARTAVDRVAEGSIPPEADLSTPDWWETIDPLRTPTVTVKGSAAAERSTSFYYELGFGCGVQPPEDRFTTIGAGHATSPLVDRPLARWSTASAAALCGSDLIPVEITAPSGVPSPFNTPDQHTVTLRLRVFDADGRRGESRRTVYLHHDPDLREGFPMSIGGSGEGSPLFAAIGRHHDEALVVPTSDGTVLALDARGRSLPGWPVHTDPLPLHTGSRAFASGALSTDHHEATGIGAAAADLDHDGTVEIVATTLAGKLYVWEPDGSRRPGFPVATNAAFSARSARDRFNRLQRGIAAAPVLADLDGDGKLEIIAGAMDRHLYVWREDASVEPGFPVLVVDRTQIESIDPASGHVVPKTVNGRSVALQGTKIISTPAVGPLRGDGKPVIVVGTNEEYAETPNFSVVGNAIVTAGVASGLLSPGNGRLYAIPATGNLDAEGRENPAGPYLRGWPAHIGILQAELLPWIEGVPGSPALADVDGDGKLEIGIASVVGPAYVLKADGTSFYGNGPDGLPIALASDRPFLGPLTDSLELASIPALGSGTFARLLPQGPVVFIEPAAGLGKALDAALPAEQLPHDNHLDAWDARTGLSLPTFPRLVDDLQFFTNPTVVDFCGAPHILAGSGGYLLHAFDALGLEAPGWPKFTGNWILASPAAARFGHRGAVALTTREAKLWVWDVNDPADGGSWTRFHHDDRNTGLLDP